MKKIKTILPITLGATLATSCILPTITSCGQKDLYHMLRNMPNVAKVTVLPNLPQYQARYMVWFKHPIDGKDESKGTFLQRCEFCFRGLDRVNQLFTCGYELRAEVLNRTDYEIAEHFDGNLIKPEYRFFDQSRPEGLDNHKVDGGQYLDNTQAVKDFHSMITAFKTILTGKGAFTGTSKGGETANAFAMVYPNDCDVYVPYVAPKFYSPQGDDAKAFQINVYNTIGDSVLGTETAETYRKEIAKFQYYALKHKHDKVDGIDLYEKFGQPYKDNDFCRGSKENHENVYDVCIQECATQFGQANQDIGQLIEFNNMSESDEKNRKCVEIAQGLNDPSSGQQDSLFFPYAYQAKTEMGEYDYDFVEMKKSLIYHGLVADDAAAEALLCQANKDKRKDFIGLIQFSDEQYAAGKDKYDGTYAQKMLQGNETCPVHIFRIYGGTDVGTGLKLPDRPSDKVKIYYGNDKTNPRNRSHTTRIKGLSPDQQREIGQQLESLLNK